MTDSYHEEKNSNDQLEDIIVRARSGNQAAIENLIAMVSAQMTKTHDQDVKSISPSLIKLLDILRKQKRRLSEIDRELASSICFEMAEKLDSYDWTTFYYSKTPNMMHRVRLFESEEIEIRAHIFLQNVEETFIHNHGQPFISTCLQGSYTHKLWSIVDKQNSVYYTHSRQAGGLYGEPIKISGGEPEKILCQPFSAGQTLFISSRASHTVTDAQGDLVTIVLRDKVRDLSEVTVVSLEPDLTGPAEIVIPIYDHNEKERIFLSLCSALRNFKRTLLLQELKDSYDITRAAVENILDTTSQLMDSANDAKRDFYYKIATLVGIIVYWHQFPDSLAILKPRLETLLLEFIGSCMLPQSVRLLVEHLDRSLTGNAMRVFGHLMFLVGFANIFRNETNFYRDIHKELVQILRMPNVDPSSNQNARQSLLVPWLSEVVKNPAFI